MTHPEVPGTMSFENFMVVIRIFAINKSFERQMLKVMENEKILDLRVVEN